MFQSDLVGRIAVPKEGGTGSKFQVPEAYAGESGKIVAAFLDAGMQIQIVIEWDGGELFHTYLRFVDLVPEGQVHKPKAKKAKGVRGQGEEFSGTDE